MLIDIDTSVLVYISLGVDADDEALNELFHAAQLQAGADGPVDVA